LEAGKAKLRELASEVLLDRLPTPSIRSDDHSSNWRKSNR
jgi:hypothetical protein